MVLIIKNINLINKKIFRLINFEYDREKFNERLTKFKEEFLKIKLGDVFKIYL